MNKGKVFRRGVGDDVVRLKRGLFTRSPCNRPPVKPTGLTGSLEHHLHKRHNKVFAPLRWTEVVTDTSGLPVRLKHYVLEIDRSEDGVTWTDTRRHTVSAKHDDDSSTKDHYTVTDLSPHFYYRYRVYGVSSDGCKSPKSNYHSLGIIGGELPPDVTGLSLDVDEHSGNVKWSYPVDSLAGDNHRDAKVDHAWVEVWRTALGPDGTLEQRDKQVQHDHWKFRIQKPGTDTFYARVYTVSEKGTKSAGVSTSAAKSTPSTPSGPAVEFDVLGTRHARYRALVTIATVTATDNRIAGYDLNVVTTDTHSEPDDDSGDKKGEMKRVHGDAHGNQRTAVFRGLRKAHYVWARERAIDTQHKESAWSAWTDAGRPQDSGATSTPAAP